MTKAFAAPDGMAIPGLPRTRSATIVLGNDHVSLKLGEVEARLPWSGATIYGLWGLRDTSTNWWISSWISGNDGGELGIGLHTGADLADHVKELSDMTRRAPLGLDRLLGIRPEDSMVVPLDRSWFNRPTSSYTTRMTFGALCQYLRDRPSLRRRLTDPHTVSRLVADIAKGGHGARGIERNPVRRVSVEIHTAVHSLGIVHPLGGRPVEEEPLPWTRQAAVAAVQDYISRNRYAEGIDVASEAIREFLDRNYFSVDPWPFGALVN